MKNWAGVVILAGLWALLLVAACESPVDMEVKEIPNTPITKEPVKPTEPTEPAEPVEPAEPAEPTEPAEPGEHYTINIIQADNGVIFCNRTSAAAGAVIRLTLSPQDEHYRYLAGSLAIEPDVELTDMGDGVWAFTMPEEEVSIMAEFEEVPLHTVTVSNWDENGSFSVTGIETNGEAREGVPITITVMPHPGYKLADDGLVVTPEGAVAFARVEGQLAWTFTMVDADLAIGVEFTELGLLEIYKGGARRGISAGELSDDPKYFADSVDMESEEPGRNGNQRAIKITHALNTNGNTAQQSFGLFSDAKINLETVSALSFWARANKKLNIRYVGFGNADPNQRIVYTGENYNQQISIGVEWKQYIIPVPVFQSGQCTDRAFFFNALLAIGDYVCIDDIEFINSGVTLTEITIPDTNDTLFYGPTDAAKILKGVPVKMVFFGDDRVITILQNASNNHTLKYNLAPWLIPFVKTSGNDTLLVDTGGVRSNPMTVRIIGGLLLDDFEDIESTVSTTIPGTPADNGTGYLWHTTSSGSVVVSRDYVTTTHQEIHGGLHAGSWRPAATANKPRGGRNFDAKNAADCNTLSFWIKVTVGGGNTALKKNTVFTFELRNGGALAKKTEGAFFARQFTYNTDNADGWQEVIMPLADFINMGLDITAITGYAFGVVDNQGSALRIMLDDIALIP